MAIKVISPANIAFVKHWGMSLGSGLPANPSLSMNLSGCQTLTEIDEFDGEDDLVEIENFDGQIVRLERDLDLRDNKVFRQIELIRALAESDKKVKIKSRNKFPTKAGIASSASGFSALTFGLVEFFGLELDKQNMARLVAKAGSISAVRSLCENFGGVKVNEAGLIEISEIPDLENLVDIIAVVDTESKQNSSLVGQNSAETSPLFEAKKKQSFVNYEKIIKGLSWVELGEIIEEESNMLHSVMLTSVPSQKYMNWKSWLVIDKVLELALERNPEALPDPSPDELAKKAAEASKAAPGISGGEVLKH
jgi:diphosphomevalonate decarboxylase